jgi:microcystin-dependent protein
MEEHMDVYVGMVIVVPFAWAPEGFLTCSGQQLQLQQYAALYAVLGSAYGGDNVRYFNLPNLMGRVPIGAGTSLTSGTNFKLAQVYGQEQSALNAGNMPPHSHAATFAVSSAPQSVAIPAVASSLALTASVAALQATGGDTPQNGYVLAQGGAGGSSAPIYVDPATAPITVGKATLGGLEVSVSGAAGNPQVPVSVNTVNGGNVAIAASTGAAAGFSVLQPSIAMNFVMAVVGLYPNRP